jgi:hypothetical protein
MAAKRKVVVIVIMSLALLLCAFYFYNRAQGYGDVIFIKWVNAYDNGDDIAARELANKFTYIDPEGRAFYLAQIDVSDSIHLTGEKRNLLLSGALKRLEDALLHLPNANERDVFLLKASLAALNDDRRLAEVYAKKACKLMKIKNVGFEDCLGGHYSFGDPGGSRWAAIQLYENATLYNALGTGDKANSKFYEALALKYFDLGQAHELIGELKRERRFSDEMKKTYCNPASPPDIAVCDLAI